MTRAPERARPVERTATGPYVGRPVDRVDGVAKTSGEARYAAEHPYPDLAHATLVHATVARGRITHIDTAAATAVPGVLAVLTHGNAPRMVPLSRPNVLNPGSLAPGARVNYLNTDEVHWNGQPVAVVVAETSEAAHAAARLVRVEIQPLPAVVDFVAAQDAAVPVKGNLLMTGEARTGDPEGALATAAVRVDHRYSTPPQNHNALEPHASTAVWDGGRLTVHDATQNIDWTRRHLATRFGIPVRDVRVIATYVGGGFGGKASVWAGTVLTALAAKATGRPVRMALTREAVYRTVGGRTPSIQRVALGAEHDGRLTALVHTGVTQVGRVGGAPEPVATPSSHLYAAPNMLIRHATTTLDVLPNTFMRAPGDAIGSFALESALDELAAELAMDPVELRLRNEPERSPLDGKRFTRRDLRTVYARGARRFGWDERPAVPRATREGRWLVGWGMATAFYMPGQMPADVAVRLNADGTVLVRCSFHEIGVGAATAQAQITADALGVPLESITVEHGDSAQPVGPGAFGSAQTASVAAGILQACDQLTRALQRLARRFPGSPLRSPGVPQAQPSRGRHGAASAGAPLGESYAVILARAGLSHLEVRTGSESRLGRGLTQARFIAGFVRDRRRFVRAATGAHFCQVKVDAATGEVRVTRWLGIFDVGRVINAKLAASQLRGGIVMGIGAALFESTLIDPRTGRIMNPGLAEYHVPVHADVPPIDIEYLDEPDPTTPLGLLGVGEVGITGVAAAVANAVFHATGMRVRDLPITLDRLL